jgi:hypothetical protein
MDITSSKVYEIMMIIKLPQECNIFRHEITKFCVISGGIAGISLAWKVAKGGRRVVARESGVTSFDENIHRLNEVTQSRLDERVGVPDGGKRQPDLHHHGNGPLVGRFLSGPGKIVRSTGAATISRAKLVEGEG